MNFVLVFTYVCILIIALVNFQFAQICIGDTFTCNVYLSIPVKKLFMYIVGYREYWSFLKVRAIFHKTVRVSHVYCNFKIGFTCRITVIFGTLKDESLLINTVASNICFSYRNMFQNGVDALSKIVDASLSKSSKLYLVRIIRQCSNFASLWHKHLLRNYKWHFRHPMSALATTIWNTLSKHQLFTLNFAFKLFHVSIVIDICRSQIYHL